jgi:APA family basic amino acid/polyamine antiporter
VANSPAHSNPSEPNPYNSPSAYTVDDSGRATQGALPRILGRFDAITVVIGSIIGSGIFLKPSAVAKDLGQYGFGAIIAVWIIVGLITLCGSLALAELAAMLPQAGGPYVYLREAYGRMVAFLWGWTEFWVVRTGSLGALAVGTVIYLSEAFRLHDPTWELSHRTQELLAVLIVVGLSTINFVATRWAANVQNATVVVKVAFLIGIIVLPFVTGGFEPGNLSSVLTQAPGSAPASGLLAFLKAFGIAAIAVLWPYDGWINIGPVAEEIREPQKNVPFALAAGMCIVIAVYAIANVGYHLVLPIDAVAGSEKVASDVCLKLIGPTGAIVFSVGVMCSMFGAVNSNMMTGPRIYFAMARDGLVPKSICHVHSRFQTPANAIVAQTVWTVALTAICFDVGPLADVTGIGRLASWLLDREVSLAQLSPYDAFNALTDFVIFGGSIFYASAVAAVFVLRIRYPHWPRPYRTFGYPFVPALYLLFFLAVLTSMLISDPETSLAGTSLIAAGAIYYLWARTRPAARVATGG